MTDIKLRVPRVIDGVVRQPAEGVITVPDDLAEQLILEEAADDATVEDDEGGEDDLDDKKVSDLKTLAAGEGVDLGAATTKAEIIAAIRAHRADAGA